MMNLGAMNDRQSWLPPQQAPMWKATQGAMNDPKQQVMMAMLARQLAQAGHNLAGGAPTPMPRGKARVPDFDPYGNMQG